MTRVRRQGASCRSHKPSSSRLRAQCLPGLREQQRPRGTGWEGWLAWDEGRVPRNTRHPDARVHAGWGLYRAGAARLGGPGSRPDLCRAAPQHSLCERGNGWWYQLRARITPSPWGPTAGARPGPWRMETRAVTYPGANSEPGREKAPTRPRGGRPWNVRVHPRAYLGHLLFFRRPQPAEGQVYTSQVVRRPPQRGRSSGQALSLLPCLLLRPVAQDGLGGGEPRGRGWKVRGLRRGSKSPLLLQASRSHRLALCWTKEVPEASDQSPAAHTPRRSLI